MLYEELLHLYTHESNHLQYVMCLFIVQILAQGGRAQEKEWGGGLWVYYSHGNIVSQKQLNLPELFPKGMNYEGIYGAPYIAMFILNLWLTEPRAGKPL